MPSMPKKTPSSVSSSTTKTATTAAAPSSSSKKKLSLSHEEQVLLIKQRREVIEQRIVRLQSKIAKDQALLHKYTQPTSEGSSGSDDAPSDATLLQQNV